MKTSARDTAAKLAHFLALDLMLEPKLMLTAVKEERMV